MIRRAWLPAVLCALPLAVHAALGPRYGGELRIGAIAASARLDVQGPAGPVRRMLLAMAHETLVRRGPDGPVPSLASSWTASEDGREWTLALGPSLRFHDGSAVTGDAAARAVRSFLASDSPAAAMMAEALEGGAAFRSTGAAPSGLEARDGQGLLFRFRAPASPWALLPLASPAAAITAERGQGCGPFVPSVTTGDELLFVAFGDHVGGRPYLDRVRVRLVADARRLAAERLLGRVDVALGPVGRLHAPGVVMLALDTRRGPFGSRELRTRLAAALGRDALTPRLVEGAEAWPRLLPLEGTPASAFPAPRPGRKSTAARASLTRVRLAVDRTLPPLASQRILAQLADVGLGVDVRPVDADDVRSADAEARLFVFEPEVDDPLLAAHELAALAGLSVPDGLALLSDAEARLGAALALEERVRATSVLIPLARMSRATDEGERVRGTRDDRYTLRLEDAWTRP